TTLRWWPAPDGRCPGSTPPAPTRAASTTSATQGGSASGSSSAAAPQSMRSRTRSARAAGGSDDDTRVLPRDLGRARRPGSWAPPRGGRKGSMGGGLQRPIRFGQLRLGGGGKRDDPDRSPARYRAGRFSA